MTVRIPFNIDVEENCVIMNAAERITWRISYGRRFHFVKMRFSMLKSVEKFQVKNNGNYINYGRKDKKRNFFLPSEGYRFSDLSIRLHST